MQGRQKDYAKMGYLKVKFLPLKTFFKNGAPAASLAQNQVQNSENNSLVPQ